MPAAQRTVRHLRLQAPGAEQARRLLPVLEDALRCASLGDGESSRLLVVRRLALGPLAPGISAQALARLIEQRSAEAQQHWVDAAHASADTAGCVAFSGALDARVQLALRLLRGQPCSAWYWPLAVPEYSAQADAAGNLRAIACAVAGWPEARSALPAWLASAVQAGQAAPLARAIGPVLGPALLQQAGLGPVPPMHVASIRPPDGPSARAGATLHRATPATGPHAPLPAWLQHALRLAPPTWLAPAPAAAQAPPLPPGPTAAPGSPAPEPPTAAPTPARMRDRQPSPPRAPQPQSPPEPGTATVAGPVRPAMPAAPPLAQPPWLDPTGCGGLLFLLPLLARLGLPHWLPADAPRFTALVLRAALLHLRAPADDPAWWLAATPAEATAAPHRPPTPAGWPARLLRGTTRGAQAATWLAACVLWLRRAGGPTLAGLVRRPARLALTATHADLFFALDQTDLAVRRLGLDIDPGWLPWFGRVVGFHYGAAHERTA